MAEMEKSECVCVIDRLCRQDCVPVGPHLHILVVFEFLVAKAISRVPLFAGPRMHDRVPIGMGPVKTAFEPLVKGDSIGYEIGVSGQEFAQRF